MSEDRVAKAIDLLERVAEHDHQGRAIMLLTNPPNCPLERLEAYDDRLNEVARTDIQGWAKLAIWHLKGGKDE